MASDPEAVTEKPHRAEVRSISSAMEVPPEPSNIFTRLYRALDMIPGLEAIGIERIPEEMRHPRVTIGSYVQMFLIWFSINCTANNMTIGILGPVLFGLGLKDAIICCLFGNMFGSACTGYISSLGPKSGLRTLIIARYTMGYWPSKICVLLNLVIELGYGLVDCLIAGLILSAVTNHKMTVIVGIVVSALITWVVATFGIKWFNQFERYIWVPTVLVLFVLIGVAGPHFNPNTLTAAHTSASIAGSRLSYFFLTASGPLGWAPASADFYSYYPPKTSRLLTGLMTASGITLGKLLIEFLGIGLASGIATTSSWDEAFGHSAGALIAESFAPLGGFGKFCAVVLAVCVSANNIPGTYAAALNLQMLGRWFAMVPRPLWSTVVVVAYTACAIGGRTRLFQIFLNFLALIGYWVIIWITITLEDEFIFRRLGKVASFDWMRSSDRSYLPVGVAALCSFLVGWAGAIVSMCQTYYTGPIAKLVGSGADLGLPVAMSWASISYPAFRLLELKYIGR